MSTADHEEGAEHEEGEEGTSSGAMAFSSLWGLGASVLGNVQKNTTTFVNTIVETDWKKELQDIQDGLRTETEELEKDIGTRLGVSQSESVERSAPAETDAEGVSIADIGRRFLTGTAEIFQQVRATVDSEFTNLEQEATTKKPRSSLPRGGREGAKFSRLDMKISAMQRNSATYCDEPDDADAFSAFLAEYDEEARTTQATDILSSNPFMSELHSRLVPLVITDETFWKRYFFRLQKLTEEYEKVQERLQAAHRRASKAEPDNEPLDFALSGTIGKSPVTSPTARDAEAQQNGNGADESAAADSNQLSPRSQQSSAEKQEAAPSAATAAASASDTGAPAELPASSEGDSVQTEAPVADDKKARSPAHAASFSGARQDDESDVSRDAAVQEEGNVTAEATQPSEQMSAVAVDTVQGGDGNGEEGNGSARSSGNEKFSSDWSVVSPTANGNSNSTAAGSPKRQDQTKQAADEPAKAQEAAEQPADKSPPGVSGNGKDASDKEDDEDVDFDDLEDGLEYDEGGDDAEDGEEEDLDDNWGWE